MGWGEGVQAQGGRRPGRARVQEGAQGGADGVGDGGEVQHGHLLLGGVQVDIHALRRHRHLLHARALSTGGHHASTGKKDLSFDREGLF